MVQQDLGKIQKQSSEDWTFLIILLLSVLYQGKVQFLKLYDKYQSKITKFKHTPWSSLWYLDL